MVKVSTLFHRVDGFDLQNLSTGSPEPLDLEQADVLMDKLLSPLEYDPGDALVQKVLQNI